MTIQICVGVDIHIGAKLIHGGVDLIPVYAVFWTYWTAEDTEGDIPKDDRKAWVVGGSGLVIHHRFHLDYAVITPGPWRRREHGFSWCKPYYKVGEVHWDSNRWLALYR